MLYYLLTERRQSQGGTHVAYILLGTVLELLASLAALLEVCFVVTLLGTGTAFVGTLLFTL